MSCGECCPQNWFEIVQLQVTSLQMCYRQNCCRGGYAALFLNLRVIVRQRLPVANDSPLIRQRVTHSLS